MAALSNKTVLIYDLSGTYTFIAEAFVGKCGRVLYHSLWDEGFPKPLDYLPGEGLDGIERIADPADYYSHIDLAVFPDVGVPGLQEYLRRQGIAVWGSGRGGNFERDRIALKVELEARGLDVADYRIIHGLEALREHLADADPCFVKISYFRGLSETYHHQDGFASQGWLDDLAPKLGPFQESMDFLVEEPIEGDAVEIGIDGYVVDDALPVRMLYGIEAKDLAFLGQYGIPPARLVKVAQAFLPALRDYRGPLSTEVRVTEDEDYLIDLTCRFPSPPGEIQALGMSNFAEVIYGGATGELIEPKYSHRYWAQLVLSSPVLEDHALGVKAGKRVVLHGHCRFDRKDFCVSPAKIEQFAGAIGGANTLEDAIREAIEAAESVRGNAIKFEAGAFDEIIDTIEKGGRLGLSW